ncbi:class I SAM-dependent methyltransferase [Neorhizobium lilium]|uniref:Class I SAM-dependent methyltransferase n=1 Tax=Neorhizobium lilium TaxID=2503024 RepID=A0A3S3TWY9_9HYPH|nr:class I SAM-dependent methyltransferase [Neorhizobium lilium]RWX76801.1 class I SAM-dependent methyltransferase [Neorhizobium lilium]
MSVDHAYTHPELAAIYDVLNAGGADQRFYLGLPKPQSRILDIGCGTGELALAFAEKGHEVTAVDPAPGMLQMARLKDAGARVRWIEATGQDFVVSGPFDLAIMTGHAFQVFLDDEETLVALRNIHRHLGPDGRLVFESRNPSRRAWDGWTKEATHRTHDVPGVGQVEVHYQLLEAKGEHVTFETVFHFVERGQKERSLSRLRFPSHDEIAVLLDAAGFSDVEWLGDWDGSPLSDLSPEMIVLAMGHPGVSATLPCLAGDAAKQCVSRASS